MREFTDWVALSRRFYLIFLLPLNASGVKNCFQEKVNENREKRYNDLAGQGPEIQDFLKTPGEFHDSSGAGERVSSGFGQSDLAGLNRMGPWWKGRERRVQYRGWCPNSGLSDSQEGKEQIPDLKKSRTIV